MRICGLLALAGLASSLLINSSSAAVAPELNIDVDWGGATTWSHDPSSTGSSGTVYEYDGGHTASTAGWAVNWDLAADADPFITGGFSVTNSSASTLPFTITFTLPISPALTPSSLMGGSIAGSITSDSTGGTITNIGSIPIYTGMADGVAVAGTTLMNSVSASSGPFLSSNLSSESFGNPIPSFAGPAVLTSIGIQLNFTLTPGDTAAFTSVFVAAVVPEPASLSLLGLAGFALVRRRR